MARTTHTAAVGTGKYPTAPVSLTWVAADATNKEETVHTGTEIIMLRNSGATPRVCTITSVADSRNRTGDITFTLAAAGSAGYEKAIGPLGIEGFQQTNGKIYFEAAHAEVLVAVYRP